MLDAFRHNRSTALAGALVLALSWAATMVANPDTARAAESATEAQREVRPAPGKGQRGWLSLPAWAVWSAGAVLAAAAARSLYVLARNGGRP